MIECVECGASQFEGTLFCSECGKSLIEPAEQHFNVLPFSKSSRRSLPPPIEGYKLTPASAPKEITLVVPGSQRRLTTKVLDKALIGRSDDNAELGPDIDLSDHDAIEKGVSRVHAALQLTDRGLVLVDLGSTNGTVLNRKLITPEKPFLLKSGDEIRFGDLLVHIFFEL